MFSLFHFSSILPGGQLTPFAPMCGRPCTKVRRYNWLGVGSLGRPFPTIKYIFEIKRTEAILSNSARKLLRFEIGKIVIAVLENAFIVLFML